MSMNGTPQDDHIRPDEMPRLAHVPGHDEQDGGERGQRHIHGQGREEQDDQHQRKRMNYARKRTGAAVAHVRRSPGNRARRGEAAEQGRDDVRDTLPDELLVACNN
jgi:hypothetical protein